jgi:hypothetical protein
MAGGWWADTARRRTRGGGCARSGMRKEKGAAPGWLGCVARIGRVAGWADWAESQERILLGIKIGFLNL